MAVAITPKKLNFILMYKRMKKLTELEKVGDVCSRESSIFNSSRDTLPAGIPKTKI